MQRGVLVVGGGIGGVQATLDLAQSGLRVYLVESKPSIGGEMARLDKTFPTNDCSMCILSPKLVEVGRHPGVELLTNADVLSLEGEPGDMTATVRVRPRYVNTDRCIGCGKCAEKCPVKVPHEFDEGLGERRAAYIMFPQSVPLKYAIDAEVCLKLTKDRCGVCAKVCPAEAIDFDQEEQVRRLEVGSVVLAPGVTVYDPSELAEYGHGRMPNVITSMQFERMLNASGPTGGHLRRPSDGAEPRRIGFIQCIGSRDENTASYCSSVCCMYAIKECVIAKEHSDALEELAIFYMDMRTSGKEFEDYRNRAEGEHGIEFINCRVPSVQEHPSTRDLSVRYVEGQDIRERTFDMVVLSVGLRPPAGAEELAGTLGIELDGSGYCATPYFSPVDTTRRGVFACGAFTGPKDIPETVAQSSGAAARAAAAAQGGEAREVTAEELAEERDVTSEPVRVGVFVCHCGTNIGGVVDVPSVVEYARTLPGVAYAEENLYSCSQDAQERFKERIAEHGLNRVVVASCTPRTHEPLFQNTIREAGLNRYLFEMANIRDQCSWVHMHEPEAATAKAKDLVRMTVAKARGLHPLTSASMPVSKRALVIGGGVAGMSAALGVASQGFACHLVEREAALGGNARAVTGLLEGEDPQERLADLVRQVNEHPLIEVTTSTEVESLEGFVGSYSTRLSGREGPVEHGVVIIATGARELKPEGMYLYGEDERVLTQQEFEAELGEGDPPPGPVVMIQCVGSRSAERPYCSRVCCTTAVKNAIRVREVDPGMPVYVLYRDMRTSGLREEHYRRAAELGVVFVRYDADRPPQVEAAEEGVRVRVEDLTTGEALGLTAGRLVLSSATLPRDDNEVLAKMLKVPLSKDGFFLEAHMKLRPLDFATDGVFLCGMAQWPKFIDESVAQGLGAAARAATVLALPFIEAEGVVAWVDGELCRGCGRCVDVCEYGANALEDAGDGVMVCRVNEVLCKGCGVCAVRCPSKAITVRHFTDGQLLSMVEALMERGVS